MAHPAFGLFAKSQEVEHRHGPFDATLEEAARVLVRGLEAHPPTLARHPDAAMMLTDVEEIDHAALSEALFLEKYARAVP